MEFPSEVKPALWGAAGGAILLAIVGFTWGGWMTTSAANKLADQRADVAVAHQSQGVTGQQARHLGRHPALGPAIGIDHDFVRRRHVDRHPLHSSASIRLATCDGDTSSVSTKRFAFS